MNGKKFLFLAVASFLMFVGISYASAATTTPTTSAPIQSQAITVATVNVYNAKIDSQTGNTLNISFDLTNRTGVQPQIRYAVMLIKQTSSTQTLVDEKVYNDVISLGENDQRHITAIYQAPAFLNGTYMLAIDTRNESGFPFGTIPVSQVTLTGSGQSLSIDPSTSYFTVTQDATTTNYNIFQGVDVKSSENLILHANISNPTSNDITAIPHITTYYRDMFGKVMGTQDFSSITVPKNSTTTFSFEIPKPTDPQSYDAVLTLNDSSGNQISNILSTHYVVYGVSATIQNVLFNKQSYQKGDTAIVSFLWSGSADTFYGSRLGGSSSTPVNLSFEVKDANGASCSDPYVTSLTKSGFQIIDIPITNNCKTPVANVTLKDQSGNILASNTFTTASTTSATSQNSSILWIIFWIIIIIAIAIVFIYYYKQKKGSIFTKSKGSSLMILLLIVGGVMLYGGQAKAYTFYYHDDLGNEIYYNGSIISNNYNSFFPNSPIELSGSIDSYYLAQDYAYPSSNVISNGPRLGNQYTYQSNGESYLILSKDNVQNLGIDTNQLLALPSYNLDYNGIVNGQIQNFAQITSNNNSYLVGSPVINTFTTQSEKGVYPATFSIELSAPNVSNAFLPTQIANGYIPYFVGVPTSTPYCEFSANPSTINSGGSSDLVWTCVNVNSCAIDNNVGNNLSASGYKTVNPSANTTYTLSCSGNYGSATATTTITVDKPPVNPNGGTTTVNPNCTMTANPPAINKGDSSLLSWKCNENVGGSCTLSASGNTFLDNQDPNGSTSVSPLVTTRYTLFCQNSASDIGQTIASETGKNGAKSSGGTSAAYATVTVTQQSQQQTSNTPSCTISSDKSQLVPPQKATLNWNCVYVTPGTCYLNGTKVDVNSNNGGLIVSPTSTTNYTVSCNGLDGSTPSASTKITVSTTSIHEIAP